MRLTLTADQVSPILDVFTGAVTQDICNCILSGSQGQAFSCSQISIRSVKPGSIFVDFDLLPRQESEYMTSWTAYQILVDDVHSAHSVLLHNGTYTRFLDLNWPLQGTSYQAIECSDGRLLISCPNSKPTTQQAQADTQFASLSDINSPARMAILGGIGAAGVLLLIVLLVLIKRHRAKNMANAATQEIRNMRRLSSEVRLTSVSRST